MTNYIFLSWSWSRTDFIVYIMFQRMDLLLFSHQFDLSPFELSIKLNSRYRQPIKLNCFVIDDQSNWTVSLQMTNPIELSRFRLPIKLNCFVIDGQSFSAVSFQMTNHSLLFENGLRDPWKYVSEADCLNTMDSELRTENGINFQLLFYSIKAF